MPGIKILSSRSIYVSLSNVYFRHFKVLRKEHVLSRNSAHCRMYHNFITRRTQVFKLVSAINIFNFRSLDTNCKYFCKIAAEQSTSNETQGNLKTSFQQMLYSRKKQAQKSVLLELSNKKDISCVTSLCKQFGAISNAYSYSGESGNVFLLLEFENENEAHSLLSNCQCRNIIDTFPVFSRMVQFEKKYVHDKPESSVKVMEDEPANSLKSHIGSVSELIEDVYVTEKLSELNTRLRFFFCSLLKDSISGLFPHCDVIPFGSSVNGIGRQGCDLDLMIRLYPEQINQDAELFFFNKTCVGDIRALQKRTIFSLGDFIRTFLPGISYVQKILHARMPILKFEHKILGLNCDVSVNNMSAILMSDILFFCGEIDGRVRPLIYAVKKWAKDASITAETPGSWITNFGLSLLVIFFLQNRPVPILPPLNNAVRILGEESAGDFRLEYLKPVSEWKGEASSNKETLAILLEEFLAFLGSHPFKGKHISVLTGMATPAEKEGPIWLQYPIEEDKNVTKNISASELWDLCEKGRLSSKYLSSNINVKFNQPIELSVLLGVLNFNNPDTRRSKKLNMSSLLNEPVKNTRKKIDRIRAI